MSVLLSALCAVSANLDTLAVSIAFGLKKVKVSFLAAMTISLISTFGTWLSLYFGVLLAHWINSAWLTYAGALILIGLGVWFAIAGIREIRGHETSPEVLAHPEIADTDHSGRIDFKESIIPALALTINNLGVGAAAGVAGVSPWLTTIFTFIATLLAIQSGVAFGKSFIAHWLGKYASFLSGCVIVLVGLASLFG